MTDLPDPVVRTFRIPRDLYERLGNARGLESLNGEVVRRLEASFRPVSVWVTRDPIQETIFAFSSRTEAVRILGPVNGERVDEVRVDGSSSD